VKQINNCSECGWRELGIFCFYACHHPSWGDTCPILHTDLDNKGIYPDCPLPGASDVAALEARVKKLEGYGADADCKICDLEDEIDKLTTDRNNLLVRVQEFEDDLAEYGGN